MRLLQVCNVGRILGGTAACAWTVTRALPDVEHTVAFLSRVCRETAGAFEGCQVEQWRAVSTSVVRGLRPDAIVLHNIHPDRFEPLRSHCVVQYVHSRGRRAGADATVYCSRWLADASHAEQAARVLYQAVPKPVRPTGVAHRSLRDGLTVGRICTPSVLKWPDSLVGFYRKLSGQFPSVLWEFVGCPGTMEASLRGACGGKARFHAAGWSARSLLWEWDAMLYHHPSVTESFGRTAAESMRAGCIPVVDARGGFVEQVPRGCGFLCAQESDFQAALMRLLDRGERYRLSRAAMAHADNAFSLARFRKDFLALVRSAVGRDGPAAAGRFRKRRSGQ